MSSSKENQKLKYRYIYNLPYPERRALTQLLDADEKWEDLGGLVMKLDQIELSLMRHARYRNDSPTNLLLEKFGQRNGTIDELFIMLSKIQHYRAMCIIVEYVNPKYHHLLKGNKTKSYGMFSSAANAMPFDSNSRSSLLGAYKMTSSEIEKAKFKDDPSNFNSDSSITTLVSKMSMMANVNNNIHVESSKFEEKIPFNKKAHVSQTQNGMSPTGVVEDKYSNLMNNDSMALSMLKSTDGIKKLNIPVTDGKKSVKKSEYNKSIGAGFKSDASFRSEELPKGMQISHRDILKATNNFDDSRILGRGGFGIVYKAEWKGVNVAIKRLLPKSKPNVGDTFIQEISLKQSLTEMRILNSCRIDNILPLYGVCLDSPEPCIVYQYMINGSLEDRLLCKSGTIPLNWTQRAEIADGTAKGLNYLHSLPDKPLVHGDIKSANILLDSDMKAKIGDFGLAREGPGNQYSHIKVSSVHGTQVYLPPEYLRQSHLSPKVDVYSYGIVLLEICTGQRAFNDKRPKNKLLIDFVADVIRSGDSETLRDPKAGNQVLEWFDEMLRLGQKCSQTYKSKRPNMSEVLKVFEQARQAIIRTERIRKLSKETGILPVTPQLSPLELQVWYDVKKGPDFMNNTKLSPIPRPKNEESSAHESNFNQIPPHFESSNSTSYSEIRAPPSLMEEDNEDIYDEESSCQATAGSENNVEQGNLESGGNNPSRSISNNSNSLPCLTILGTKPPTAAFPNRGESSELGPTPHPSGIVSDSPCFNINSLLSDVLSKS